MSCDESWNMSMVQRLEVEKRMACFLSDRNADMELLGMVLEPWKSTYGQEE